MRHAQDAKVLVVMAALALACSCARAGDERVLFSGFEKDKLLKWTKLAKEEGDLAHIILPGDRGREVYTMTKGAATEGAWSLLVSAGGDEPPDLKKTPHYGRTDYPKWARSYIPWKLRYKSSVSLQPGRLANLLDGPEFTRAMDRFGHRLESGSHHKLVLLYTGYAEQVAYPPEVFPRDWSGFSFLRLDVRPEKAELKFRVAVEDDKVAPAVEKRFVVPAGKWSTLEIDLDKAVKERSLNLSRILSFWTHWEETSAPTRIYVDNIRLSRKGVKARHPVLRGGERVSRPVAEMPAAAKLKPVRQPVKPGEPLSVEMGKIPSGARFWRGYGGSNRYLRLWAYDNQRMLLEYSRLLFISTVDGGKTWKKLGDRGWMIIPAGAPADPQASSVMDREGNIIFVGEWGPCIYHACPPLDSLYVRKLVITADGWTPSPVYLIPSESRRCAAGRRMIVLPSGRIWLAYRVTNRAVPTLRSWIRKGSIHAVYSDDGGKTWRGAGVKGKLTGTVADTLVGGQNAREYPQLAWKPYCDPLSLSPYGDHVAVTFNENDRKMRGMYWSRFDGTAWGAPAKVTSTLAAFNSIPPKDKRYSTVTLGRDRVFISTDKGVIVRDGEKWVDEAGAPAGAVLTVAGGKLFGVSWDAKTLRFWKRLAPGKWKSQVLFTAKAKEISLVAVPPASPPNFVPVAWCSRDPKSDPKRKAHPEKVSILRVPVE